MKAGLEVHQQLATRKLFCACPSELSEEVHGTLTRQLRATGGELHAVDAAAAYQASRGLTYVYETGPSDCLVEVDEEPPHAVNREALETALKVALLLNARPVDEIEVMRKIVVDGSNTAGFQRTTLIAVDGHVEVKGKRYSIPTVCLEEDAARKVGEGSGEVRYRLDRLGVPLVEIATGPEITRGPEARDVAAEIGAILRATRGVRRGIGTIREDLNVSTEGGARIEIKGVQELRLLHRYAELEEARQKGLLETKARLQRQGARVTPDPPIDVTDSAHVVERGPLALGARGTGRVMALALPGFAGTLGSESSGSGRLGREFADRVRAVGVRGIVHSDEFPNDSVPPSVVAEVRRRLGLTPADAFVIVATPDAELGQRALERVRDRAREALDGIPSETRDPLPDGTTRYSRPLPGRDRMYPETDIPPIRVPRQWVEALTRKLPELPSVARERLGASHGLSLETVNLLERSQEIERFEYLTAKGFPASSVARLLTQEIPAVQVEMEPSSASFETEQLESLLSALGRGEIAKEALPRILHALATGAKNVPSALSASGVAPMTRQGLEEVITRVVSKNSELIRLRGEAAFSGLMGDVMREVRGRRDGKEVSELLRSEISKARKSVEERR